MIDDYVYLCEISLLLSSVFKYKVPIEQQSSTCEIIDIVHSTKDQLLYIHQIYSLYSQIQFNSIIQQSMTPFIQT
jgi:hypothetical protein